MQLSLKPYWKYVLLGLLGIAVFILFFFACRNGGGDDITIPPADLTKQFTAKADIHFGEIEATASFNRIGDGIYDVTLISPEALNGMNFRYNGSEIQLSYLGMSVALSDDSLLANAMTTAIVKAVDAAARDQGITMKKDGNAIVMKGNNDNGAFELRFDKKNGSLLELSVPSMDLECTFGSADTAEE